MAWTRKILRTWSALCLALIVYAATPHVHHDAEEDRRGPEVAGLAAGGDPLGDATSGLIRDDAHESHTQTASTDGHPCALCRDKGDREPAASATPPLPQAMPPALRIDTLDVASRTELLLARRHPARGPPPAC